MNELAHKKFSLLGRQKERGAKSSIVKAKIKWSVRLLPLRDQPKTITRGDLFSGAQIQIVALAVAVSWTRSLL